MATITIITLKNYKDTTLALYCTCAKHVDIKRFPRWDQPEKIPDNSYCPITIYVYI